MKRTKQGAPPPICRYCLKEIVGEEPVFYNTSGGRSVKPYHGECRERDILREIREGHVYTADQNLDKLKARFKGRFWVFKNSLATSPEKDKNAAYLLLFIDDIFQAAWSIVLVRSITELLDPDDLLFGAVEALLAAQPETQKESREVLNVWKNDLRERLTNTKDLSIPENIPTDSEVTKWRDLRDRVSCFLELGGYTQSEIMTYVGVLDDHENVITAKKIRLSKFKSMLEDGYSLRIAIYVLLVSEPHQFFDA